MIYLIRGYQPAFHGCSADWAVSVMLLLLLLFSVSLYVCVVLISVRFRLKAEMTIAQFILTKDSFLTNLTRMLPSRFIHVLVFAPSSLSPSLPKCQCLFFSSPSVTFSLAQLCLSEVYCVGREEGRLTLQRAGGRFRTQDIWLRCQRMCAQILDCWTAHPEACLSSSQPRHNGAWVRRRRERKRRRRRLTAETTMYCASMLSYGRTIEWKLTVLQWFAVQLGIVLNTSTMLHAD